MPAPGPDEPLRSLVDVIHAALVYSDDGVSSPERLRELWADVSAGVDRLLGVPSRREELAELERRIERLGAAARSSGGGSDRSEAASSGSPAADRATAGGASTDVTGSLRALGVPAEFRIDERHAAERLPRLLERIAAYFAKNRGNLAHVFHGLQIPVTLDELGDVVAESIDDPERLDEYFEDLRECWKALVGGTWNNLSSWCEKIEQELSPDRIEKAGTERSERPWDVYRDIYQRLALFENLAETLRSRVKNHLRQKSPRLLK